MIPAPSPAARLIQVARVEELPSVRAGSALKPRTRGWLPDADAALARPISSAAMSALRNRPICTAGSGRPPPAGDSERAGADRADDQDDRENHTQAATGRRA